MDGWFRRSRREGDGPCRRADPEEWGDELGFLNVTGDNNALLGLDLRGRPTAKSEVYGELLIDDFQVETKVPGDLEPDEFGFLVGGQWADPRGLEGITLGAEYAQVRNRTYNQPSPWNRYLHRNQSLGYWGNDLDDLTVDVRGWLRRTLRGRIAWRQSRRGEGRITDPWTTPWAAHTVERGYSEPFPTGVVERPRILLREIEWHPVRGVFVTGQVSRDWVHNVGHVSGRQERRTRWTVMATLWGEPVVGRSP